MSTAKPEFTQMLIYGELENTVIDYVSYIKEWGISIIWSIWFYIYKILKALDLSYCMDIIHRVMKTHNVIIIRDRYVS